MEDNIKRKIRNSTKKLRLVEIHGGVCSHCRYDNKQLLQFHHVDKSTKKFNIGRNDYRWSKLVAEARKCILLCGNCHTLEHSKGEVSDTTDRKRKRAMLDYLNATSCSKCKDSKSELILEFHHAEGVDKDSTLNSYRGSHITLSDDIKRELDKCVVLCRNCHFEAHFDEDFHHTIADSVDSFVIRELNMVDESKLVELRRSGLSISKISNILEINKSTVSTILSRVGMATHKVSDITVDRVEMKSHILNGKNNSQIATIMNCDPSVVSRYRKKLTME